MNFNKVLDIIKNPLRKVKVNSPLDNLRIPLLTRKKPSSKVFYVCSFGGCGSKMLCAYLEQFGTVKHVHSRNPPNILSEIDINTEWFNNIPIKDQYLANYYVIYIYRDPIKAIISRFSNPTHLTHIQINPTINLNQVQYSKNDLYGIENFYDNYTNPLIKRNYKIYCIKYEDFFKKIGEFNRTFNITCDESYYPIEKISKTHAAIDIKTLQQIYGRLKERMDKMPFIKII